VKQIKRTNSVVILVGLTIASIASVGKVKPEEFNQTAVVKEVTAQREVKRVTESGRVRYGNNYTAVTEVGEKVYDLSGPRRLEVGTYRVKVDIKHNRVQFLIESKDGKAPSAVSYEIAGEHQK